MPAFEAKEPIPGLSVPKKLDGLRVRIGKGATNYYTLTSGISVIMHMPMDIPEEVDGPELFRILGQSNRLNMPYIYKISARTQPTEGIMTVGTRGYHETNMLSLFWKGHNQDVVVSPTSGADDLELNATRMDKGFMIPIPGIRHVQFEAIGRLQ